MKARDKLPTYLKQEEVLRLLDAITDRRDYLLFSTIYSYGLRVSEACRLDRSDVDLRRRTIRIIRAKGGVSGVRPIFRALARPLAAYLSSRTDEDPALFVGRQGRLSKRSVQKAFTRYARLARLPPALSHVHVLRHSIGTHLLDAGEGIEFVQDHLGHRSIESSVVYARISVRRLSRVFERLEGSSEIAIPKIRSGT